MKKLLLLFLFLCSLEVAQAQPGISTAIPSEKPSKYQKDQIKRKYGMFIHFGINTFHDVEWSDGSFPVETYAPAEIDACQWVKTAKDAGMKYIILVAKHHEGFCLWDSKYTDYDVASSGNKTNVIEAVARECKRQGMKLGLYYSLWDRKVNVESDRKYNTYMLKQLDELMDITEKYTKIVEFWFDGSWVKPGYRWPVEGIYRTIKSREPQCQIGINWTIGEDADPHNPNAPEKSYKIIPEEQKEGDPIRYFPSDFRLGDPLLPASLIRELDFKKNRMELVALHATGFGRPSQAAWTEIFADGQSLRIARWIIELCRAVLFPGYYGNHTVNSQTLTFHLGVTLEKLSNILTQQIQAGMLFGNENMKERIKGTPCCQTARKYAERFIRSLPEMRRVLATDIHAAFDGDPAATCIGEIISCYPAIRAISNHRIAHELYKMEIPLIPRIISELAHFETGIDIHPGAEIGEYFNIDHGTGIVIGQTCIIGNHVTLYQGVTLGAKSFPTDENGNPIKGIPRHPILEDNVTVYSNATILGRITIGRGAVIGGNLWVTEDVEPYGKRVQKK